MKMRIQPLAPVQSPEARHAQLRVNLRQRELWMLLQEPLDNHLVLLHRDAAGGIG